MILKLTLPETGKSILVNMRYVQQITPAGSGSLLDYGKNEDSQRVRESVDDIAKKISENPLLDVT